ncbi:hypothetical protein CYMTET_48664 [Cymbomonas tetramitiformis]|uniref:Uncharacterized protein n=1 Tax=Cymbomonas tetramitiformis TaxID=36881 RepID=A0AAE0BT29_9CHLO|nr:hypothetical protein CYMTET_48664 [Cymbomonas tetramitiformis]
MTTASRAMSTGTWRSTVISTAERFTMSISRAPWIILMLMSTGIGHDHSTTDAVAHEETIAIQRIPSEPVLKFSSPIYTRSASSTPFCLYRTLDYDCGKLPKN